MQVRLWSWMCPFANVAKISIHLNALHFPFCRYRVFLFGVLIILAACPVDPQPSASLMPTRLSFNTLFASHRKPEVFSAFHRMCTSFLNYSKNCGWWVHHVSIRDLCWREQKFPQLSIMSIGGEDIYWEVESHPTATLPGIRWSLISASLRVSTCSSSSIPSISDVSKAFWGSLPHSSHLRLWFVTASCLHRCSHCWELLCTIRTASISILVQLLKWEHLTDSAWIRCLLLLSWLWLRKWSHLKQSWPKQRRLIV